MQSNRRNLLIGTAGLLSVAALRPVMAQSRKLRFGVGPLLPNPEDTKKAYTPVFAHLAKQLGADFELFATTDWAGMAVAMASGNLDLAWMGPWGYIIANNQTGNSLSARRTHNARLLALDLEIFISGDMADRSD